MQSVLYSKQYFKNTIDINIVIVSSFLIVETIYFIKVAVDACFSEI